MATNEKAAPELVTPQAAHNNTSLHRHSTESAQKIGNPSLNSAHRNRALSALHSISPDLPHDEWVRVLMGAKAAGLEFEDVDAWSAGGATYSAQAMRSTWTSIKPDGGVSDASLYYYAKEYGHINGNGHIQLPAAQPIKKASSSKPAPGASPDEIWARCEPATHRHSYIVRKGADSVPLDDLRVVPGGDPLRINCVSVAGALAKRVRRVNGSTSTLQFILPVEVAERQKAQGKSDKLNLPGFPVEGWFTVRADKPGDTIYICEGIGAAWSCWKATGASSVDCCGAGRMRTVATELRQRYPASLLVVVPDRGKEAAAEAIARDVRARVVHMPEGEPPNFDANDYALRKGHDALAELLEHARDPAPAQSADDGVVLTCASDITPEPIAWLWPDWLAQGKLHLLAGAPGQGKTTLALAMAATVSCGGRWPDGKRCSPGNVLIWSGEDDPADTLVPRLMGMDANLDRVHFVEGARIDGKVVPFDPARDMQALEDAARKLRGARLIVVDPIVSAITGDSHKNAEVRRDLQPLVDMAHRLGAAVLGISHFAKGADGRDPLERVIGSIAFTAIARIVMAAGNAKDGDDKRILVRCKSNIGLDSDGFEYYIEQTQTPANLPASIVTWGQPIQGTARELLAEADPKAIVDGEGKQSAVDGAADFLRQVLAAGSTPTKTVEAEAREAGVSMASIRRAAGLLRIEHKKGADAWYWSLPHGAQVGPDKNVEHLEQVEHLEPKQAQQSGQDAQGVQDAQDSKADDIEQVAPAPGLDDAETFW